MQSWNRLELLGMCSFPGIRDGAAGQTKTTANKALRTVTGRYPALTGAPFWCPLLKHTNFNIIGTAATKENQIQSISFRFQSHDNGITLHIFRAISRITRRGFRSSAIIR